MFRIIASICAALLLTLAAANAGGPGGAANASYVPGAASRDALFLQVATKPCCYNDGEYFQSTPKTCNRYGGRVVPFEYCQRAYQQPWRDGGPHYGYGYSYNNKPCCYNDGRFYQASSKTCRRFGGRVVNLDYCRRGFDRPWDDGYGDDGYGDDDYRYDQGASSNKPCCYNNGRYYHTSPSTCRRYGGYTVAYEYCTRQRGW